MEQYSDFFVTVNTHIKPKTQMDIDQVADTLMRVLKDEYYSKDGMKNGLLLSPGARVVKATIINASVEIGKKFGQIHLHFNISILHDGKILFRNNDLTLDAVGKRWWDAHLPWSRGCQCRYDLNRATTKAKNYAIKAGDAVHSTVAGDGDGGDERIVGRVDPPAMPGVIGEGREPIESCEQSEDVPGRVGEL